MRTERENLWVKFLPLYIKVQIAVVLMKIGLQAAGGDADSELYDRNSQALVFLGTLSSLLYYSGFFSGLIGAYVVYQQWKLGRLNSERSAHVLFWCGISLMILGCTVRLYLDN